MFRDGNFGMALASSGNFINSARGGDAGFCFIKSPGGEEETNSARGGDARPTTPCGVSLTAVLAVGMLACVSTVPAVGMLMSS